MGVCDGVVCAIGMDDRHLRRFWRGPVALPLWIPAFPGMTVVLQRGGAPFVLRTFPPCFVRIWAGATLPLGLPVYSPSGIPRCRFACAPPLSFGHFPRERGQPRPLASRSPSP